jgi:hypothetical protein
VTGIHQTTKELLIFIIWVDDLITRVSITSDNTNQKPGQGLVFVGKYQGKLSDVSHSSLITF